MVDILQIRQGKEIPTKYEVTENGLLIKNEKGETIVEIPVMKTQTQSGD